MTYFIFTLVVILQPIAQILEKHGMNQIGRIEGITPVLIGKLITSPFVVSGVGLSGVGLVLWLVVLSRGNVSYFYPLGAISYIILACLSYFVLGEHLGILQYLGIAGIVAGAILLNIR